MKEVYQRSIMKTLIYCLLLQIVVCHGQNCSNETGSSDVSYSCVGTVVNVYPTNEDASDTASIYVRWGRSTCRENAELVYSGITAGANAFQSGGGGNFLRMPSNPVYATTEASPSTDRAKLRGTQLYGSLFPPFQPFHDSREDITCPVCRVTRRSTLLMVPGRNLCPTDAWTLEYEGYLAASRITLQRAEFICVDSSPEGYPGTEGHDSAPSELHPVESECGGRMLLVMN